MNDILKKIILYKIGLYKTGTLLCTFSLLFTSYIIFFHLENNIYALILFTLLAILLSMHYIFLFFLKREYSFEKIIFALFPVNLLIMYYYIIKYIVYHI